MDFGSFWDRPELKVELEDGKNRKTFTETLFFLARMCLGSNPWDFQLPTRRVNGTFRSKSKDSKNVPKLGTK